MVLLGRETLGDGAQRVLVLHDWMGDHRNYDPMQPYLDRRAFTWTFADLRGYGLSRELPGRFQLDEAAADVLALADHLYWTNIHIVAHSMSTLVAQQVAALAPERVASLVLLTPVSPAGMGAPEEVIAFLEHVATDEASRRDALSAQWGERLTARWLDFKLRRWWESARVEAVRGYVRMFAATALSALPRPELPVLAVVGEHDAPHFQEAPVREALSPVYSDLTVAACANAGHYPMQETPVALAALIERFLGAHPHP